MFKTPQFGQPHLTTLSVSLVSTALTVSVALGSIILVSRVLGPVPFSVNQVTTQKYTSFDATGESEIVAIPDQATVNLGFTVTQSTVEVAQEMANTTTNSIIVAVKELGIDSKDIKTINYSIYPEYDYSNNTQKVTGFRVDNTVQVALKDTTLMNQVIDAGAAQGANQIGGVQFSLSTEKTKELTRQARKEAIEEAKTSAQELASLAGMRLGKVINISESRQDGNEYPMMMSNSSGRDMEKGMSEPTQVEPGTSLFKYSVYLSYETL